MQGLILILTAVVLNSATTECKKDFELIPDSPYYGEIKIYPIEDRLKKSLNVSFPVDCKTGELVKPKNAREFIEFLDAAVPSQFRRGLLSGRHFSRSSTGYQPILATKLIYLVKKLYKEDIDKVCLKSESDCHDIIIKRWRDYYLKFNPDEFDKLNPDDFDPDA